MKLVIGNSMFGALLMAWYVSLGDQKGYMLMGTVLLLIAFVAGTCMGYVLKTPRIAMRPRYGRAAMDASVFDQIR